MKEREASLLKDKEAFEGELKKKVDQISLYQFEALTVLNYKC